MRQILAPAIRTEHAYQLSLVDYRDETFTEFALLPVKEIALHLGSRQDKTEQIVNFSTAQNWCGMDIWTNAVVAVDDSGEFDSRTVAIVLYCDRYIYMIESVLYASDVAELLRALESSVKVEYSPSLVKFFNDKVYGG